MAKNDVKYDEDFWDAIDKLVFESKIRIDRPIGRHPDSEKEELNLTWS